MKKLKCLSLSTLLLTVILSSAFSPRFTTEYFAYSGTNEFLPGNYTSVPRQTVIGGPNTDLAWIEVDPTEVYPAGHVNEFKPMVDDPSAMIRTALIVALSNPKTDITVTYPVWARVQMKPWYY
ncbi:hypothetical protein [Paraflavitalea soli]|uniref:hypothetical protein n=1 Tax=Paraflavitalea soli TaxID=2315862 RepID=UPI0013C4A15F|nr:hypothetical protein [Paraflavitalea soli]